MPKTPSANVCGTLPCHQTELCHKTQIILSQLLLPGLLRSERLRSDIKLLSGYSLQEIDEQLSQVSQHAPALASFVKHVESSVLAKPHVLVAYAWVLYMALFSGGRYLRAALQNADAEFWLQSSPRLSSAVRLQDLCPSRQETGLSDMHAHSPHHVTGSTLEAESCAPEDGTAQKLHQFFHFPSLEDGEDIKREFKTRIVEMDLLLHDTEKDEIVEEAQHIFVFMLGVVGDLDAVCNTNVEQEQEKFTGGPVGTRLDDGDGVCNIAMPLMARMLSHFSGPKDTVSRLGHSSSYSLSRWGFSLTVLGFLLLVYKFMMLDVLTVYPVIGEDKEDTSAILSALTLISLVFWFTTRRRRAAEPKVEIAVRIGAVELVEGIDANT